MNLLEETKFLLKKYNLTANKRLGQNFLINEYPIEEAIKAANIMKEDLVIEIGPGLRNTYKVFIRKCRKSYMYRTRWKND